MVSQILTGHFHFRAGKTARPLKTRFAHTPLLFAPWSYEQKRNNKQTGVTE
jgi:hypothetical protein